MASVRKRRNETKGILATRLEYYFSAEAQALLGAFGNATSGSFNLKGDRVHCIVVHCNQAKQTVF